MSEPDPLVSLVVSGDGVDPDLVDAHCHLLVPGQLDYPWIQSRSPLLEALLPNYYEAARRYEHDDYGSDVAGQNIRTSVACEFAAKDSILEAEWIQRCADAEAGPDAFIAGIDLTSSSLPQTLARYRDMPVVRAVRQPLYWAADPLRRLGARPDFLTDPRWLKGFEQVAAGGFAWDLLVYDEQILATQTLLETYPETPIVLEAIGWPLDQSADGFRHWEERLHFISAYPNVSLKLQGLALIFGPSRTAIEPWVRRALEIFGAGRCMFASHFPVDRLLWTAGEMVDTVRTILRGYSDADQAQFFGGTARRVYRIPAR